MQLQGLRLDGKFSDSAQYTWAHARNILLSRGFDEIENEPGDVLVDGSITGTIIGRISTPNNFIIFIWQDSKTYIKVVNSDGTLHDLIIGGTTVLNYNPAVYSSIYIEGIHYYNSQNELIIAWTTGYHKPMIMNVSEIYISPLTIATESDLKELYLFPEFTHNNFNLTTSSVTTTNSIITGGKLPSAAYFVSLTYELEPGVDTNFGLISNPIFITEYDSVTEYSQFKGNGSLVITNKAISINVTNFDSNRDYFKLAVIQKTESGTNCFITNRIKISTEGRTNGISVLIDDLDKLTPFNILDIVTSAPAFNTVKTITQSNKRLRLGNLTKAPKLSLADVYDNILTPRTLVLNSNPSRTGYLVTISSDDHGLETGATITMNGWGGSGYNGHYKITKVDINSFTYTSLISSTDTSSGGTCKVDILDINWVAEEDVSLSTTKGSYKDSVFIFNNRSFRTDEVYALYLGLRLKTGGYYGIYHIPGREQLGDEITATVESTIDDVSYDLYKVKSTATKVDDYYGKMGFWENENEVYPSEYGTLGNGTTKVRHHRFPSAGQLSTWKSKYVNGPTALIDSFSSGSTFTVVTGALPYSRFFSTAINGNSPAYGIYSTLTPYTYNKYLALEQQVVALNLNYSFTAPQYDGTTDPTMAITIVRKDATGTEYDTTSITTSTYVDGVCNISYIGDLGLNKNWSLEISMIFYADTYSNLIANTSSFTISQNRVSATTLGLKISLDYVNIPTAIKNSLDSIIDGWEIFYAKRTLNNQLMLDQSLALTSGDGFRFYGFDSMANLLNIEPTHVKSELYANTGDYNNGTYIKSVFTYTLETTKYSKISSIKYLPAYNSATTPTNVGKENCYYFETLSGSFDKRLVNLINIKDNLYLDFSNQELISTGIIKRLTDTGLFSFYGGDTFISHNSFITLNVSELISIWQFPTENILNASMRYEGSNDYEKCYPFTDLTIETVVDGVTSKPYITSMVAAGVANTYFYNNDFHLLNNIRQNNIDNELTSTDTTFPNRIYSSLPQPLESSSLYWRKFRILDYFDMANHKGAIYKMLGNEYIVYIQTDYSIFRGIVVDKLVTGNIDVALKSAEMFDRPLQELLDADGNYIKPWNREGTIITPYGLVATDLDRGAIYVISDKADEITKLGVEDWFRNRVKNTMTLHATKEGIGNGVILGYDDIYKRLLVTLRDSPIAVTSVVRSLTNGTRVTVTTTASHGLTTGTYVRMKNWDVAVCNGVFVIVVTGVNTFYYTTTASTTGAVIGGTVTLYDSTMSYQFEKGQWVSFHDYIPDKYTWNSNGLYIFNNSKIYKMFAGNNGLFSGVYYPSSIDFIFNQNKGERFLLRSVKWTTNLEANNINYWNETISKLVVYSKNQCSDENIITKKSYSYVIGVMTPTGNTIYRDGEWIFNDILDILSSPNYAVLDNSFNVITSNMNYSKNWYDKSKFIGKFIIVRLIYTNSSTVRKLRISNVDIDATNIL